MAKSASIEISHETRPGWHQDAGADSLGPVVLNCRDRSWVDRQLDMGESRVGVFVLLPIAASLCISGWALLVSVLVLWLAGFDVEKLNKTMLWGFLGVTAILCCSAIYWRLLRQGQRPGITLALHQHGIRYRRRTFRFDELCAIRSGRDSQGLEAVWLAVCRLIGIVHGNYRHFVKWMEASNAASLSLVLKDGRICSMRGIGLLCEPEDFKQFMQLLGNGYPHLFHEAPSEPR
jgi:hypothetical protein